MKNLLTRQFFQAYDTYNMGILDDIKTLTGEKKEPTVEESTQTNPVTNIKKILIVEDEKLLGDALELKFKHEGFSVFRAPEGQTGLKMAMENKPDIVLLDLMMPVMDGTTMLSNLRKIPEFKTLPVIILTNAGDIEHIRETQMYYDAAEFLIKSNVSPEEIVEKVKKLVL
jgi:DNA-binding response OmpR family regulator